MANRYVNYDKLLNARHRLGLDKISMMQKLNAFNHFIDNLPSADVEEVRHGEWKPNTVVVVQFPDEYVTMNNGWKCSLCGRTERQKEPYCHCGAKMDGGKV